MSQKPAIDFRLLARVHELYRASLLDHAEPRDWLARQGVRDAATLERFEIGFAPGRLADILPMEGKTRPALQELGIFDASGAERFAGCVVVPITDGSGRVVELVGYPLGGGELRRAGDPGGIFNWRTLRGRGSAKLLADPLSALVRISLGEASIMALVADTWTERTERFFRELGPHAIEVEEPEERAEIVERLAQLSLGPKAKPAATKAPTGDVPVENGFAAKFGKRRYLVQAISQDNPRHLKALVRAVGPSPGRFHLDAMDLYSSRDRASFVREATLLFGEEVSLIEGDLMRLVAMAEEHLSKRPGSASVEVGEEARREAVEFLSNPKLLDLILADFAKLGIVGEEPNKLVGYLVAVSRKMEDPLSMLLLSRSAAGKSTLADAIATLVPPEDAIRLTRITGQALFYQKNQSFRHKLLVVEEESGVTEAAYPLRVLQSAKRLAVATSRGAHEVEGPVAVIITTTSSDLNDETKSRFLVTSADESPEQSKAIQEAQKRREAGQVFPKEDILRRHHALQRCLQPLKVVNPYAPHLSFPNHRLSMRREHPKYLGLIRAVAFLRQYQRRNVDGAIRVELADIEEAHKLADAVLGQSLDDLSPPAKRLLDALHAWKPKGCFSRLEARSHLGWGTTQLWAYLKELSDQEWILDHGGKPKSYELAWDGREGKVMLGLSTVDEIRARFGSDSASFGLEEKS